MGLGIPNSKQSLSRLSIERREEGAERESIFCVLLSPRNTLNAVELPAANVGSVEVNYSLLLLWRWVVAGKKVNDLFWALFVHWYE